MTITSTIAQEEIFRPVLSVIPASDERDAIRLANDSVYGLNADVFTPDTGRALAAARQLRSGTVGQTASSPTSRSPSAGSNNQASVEKASGPTWKPRPLSSTPSQPATDPYRAVRHGGACRAARTNPQLVNQAIRRLHCTPETGWQANRRRRGQQTATTNEMTRNVNDVVAATSIAADVEQVVTRTAATSTSAEITEQAAQDSPKPPPRYAPSSTASP